MSEHMKHHICLNDLPLCQCTRALPREVDMVTCGQESKECADEAVAKLHAAGLPHARAVEGGCPAYGESIFADY